MVMIRNHDDVAERDGGARGEEQRLDETDGYRPQGAPPPRLRSHFHRSHT
jgi:hypothetical protein